MATTYTKSELTRLLVDLITHRSPVHDMRIVVSAGADVNQSHRKGLRPLHYAAYEDNTECLRYLLDDAKADIDVSDDIGYTPLHIASKNGHYNSLKILLRRGATVNFNGDSGGSEIARALSALTINPLSLALERNHVGCVGALLEHGADANQKYFLGHEINLVPMEYHECLEILLNYGANPDVYSRGGLSPLMKACKDKQLASINILISHGASVNLQCPPRFDQKTALHFAASSGNLDIVKALLKAGAATSRPAYFDHSVLEFAIVGDNAEVVETLLQYGADPNEANKEQCSALQLAVSTMGLSQQRLILESLLNHGADPNHHSRYFSYMGPSLSPLVEYFCYMDDYDVATVRLMLASGSKVNVTRPTKLLKIHDHCGILGQIRKLRPYEEILEMLVVAADCFDIHSIRNESSLSNKQKELLISVGSSPRDLRHLARLRIRDALTLPIASRIQQLPLPSFLKDYIMFVV